MNKDNGDFSVTTMDKVLESRPSIDYPIANNCSICYCQSCASLYGKLTWGKILTLHQL